jgi:hypothetical protein
MQTLTLVAIIALVAIFALFVPVFPSSQTSEYFGVARAQVNADVSLTFLLVHCGSYIDAQYTQSFFGFKSSHPISQGYNFACNFNVNST